MNPVSPRVRYWRERRRLGRPLFAAACGSAEDAALALPMAPDLLLFHPGFSGLAHQPDTAMLSALHASGSANESAVAQVAGLLPLCAPCPVAMGVCGTDPFLLRGTAFPALRGMGLEGMANFPTIGLVDGFFRADLEAAGQGMALEAQCLKDAHKQGFFTIAFACRPREAADFAAAGCDVLIVHLGLGADFRPLPLSSSRGLLSGYLDALRGVAPGDPLMLLHGDHLVQADDENAWREMAGSKGCDGLFASGAASRVRALRELTA